MSQQSSTTGRHRINVEEYRKILASDIFAPGPRFELLDGELISTAAYSKAHESAVATLDTRLSILAEGWTTVRCGLPLELGEFNEPSPDLALVALLYDPASGRHPLPTETSLVVEIADTSRNFDFNRKIPIYAAAGIGEAWVIDLVERAIHVFRDSTNFAYQDRKAFGPDDVVTTPALPHLSLAVAEVCPAG